MDLLAVTEGVAMSATIPPIGANALDARFVHVGGTSLPAAFDGEPTRAFLAAGRTTSFDLIAAVTLGGDGSRIASRRGEVHRPPVFDVPVVDTAGCGEAYTAGFIAALDSFGMTRTKSDAQRLILNSGPPKIPTRAPVPTRGSRW
jgi:hypothetical protein